MRSSTTFSYILSVSIGLLVWKLLATAIASTVFPSPEAAFSAFFESCKTTAFWKNFGISAYRVVASILIAWSLAFPIGVFVGYSKRLDKVVSPMIFMTYPIPKIVFLPVILLMFGLGDFSKITMISIILFFQILVATRDGVQAIDEKYFDSLLSMGATDVDILKEVVFPAALPHSFTALRITTGTAISVLFFVESFATASGLGYMIMDSWARVAYTQIFVGIIGMSILGVVLYETLSYLEKRICPWQYTENENDNEEELSFSGPFIKMAVYLRMIKFSHTIFVLPFALASLVLVNRVSPITLHAIFWIIMAMVGARSAAMGFNRLADASIDSKNPRTAVREIPSGTISKTDAGLFVVVSSVLFIYSSMMLSWLCFWLSFPVLCILFCYSYTKRFTWLSHIILGFSISLVPMAVWVAVSGTFSIKIGMLCLVLLSYISGFDILYACQDREFDRKEKLYSIPAVFGIKKALAVSSFLHIISFLSLVSLYWIFSLSSVFLIFAGVIAVLFVVEHKLVRPDDLSKVNVAFYHINSIISVLLFVAILSGELLRSM